MRRLINPAKIALAGQSDGGDTVDALAFENIYESEGLHFDAVESLSGSLMPPPLPSEKVQETPGAPLLVVQSATDQCNVPQNSIAVYASVIESDKWFLTLTSGDHLPPYTGSAFLADFALVTSETTAFFVAEFAGHSPLATMRGLARRAPGVATLTTGAPPELSSLEQLPAACYLG
jgi:hypothetical protein